MLARCHNCHKSMLLVPRHQDGLNFCSDRCGDEWNLLSLVEGVDDLALAEIIDGLHLQACPCCQGAGPVDMYTQHAATSFFFSYYWSDKPLLGCRDCGVRHIVRGIVWSFFFGWWHFPIGPIVTVWQIINGVQALRSLPEPGQPSAALQKSIKLDLGNRVLRLRTRGEGAESET